MATSFLNINPLTGSGDGVISVGAQANTGRNTRNFSFKVKDAGSTKSVTVNGTQGGKAVFIKLDGDGAQWHLAKEQGSRVVVTGKSNANGLEVYLDDGQSFSIESIKVNGVTVINNTAIPSDPGSSEEYTFEIAIYADYENTSNVVISDDLYIRTLDKVTGDDTAIIQAASDAKLNVSPETLIINATGETQSISVESNLNWEVV